MSSYSLTDLENLGSNETSLMSGQMFNFSTSAIKALDSLMRINQGAQIAQDSADFNAGVYRQSGQTALQGAKFTASVYRQAGLEATVASNYNIALDQISTTRQQESLERQLRSTISTNVVNSAANGVSIGSKSTMMVQNSVLAAAERQFVNNKNDALQRQALIDYNGKLVQVQNENAARAAEYSGAVAAQQAENQARASEYQGELAKFKAESESFDQISDFGINMLKVFAGS